MVSSCEIYTNNTPTHNDGGEDFKHTYQAVELKSQISELQRLLMQEREKVLTAKLQAKQKENLAIEVENSLKEIREKYQMEMQSRQLDRERLDLKEKLKELENKLTSERQIWMHIIQNQVKQNVPTYEEKTKKLLEALSVKQNLAENKLIYRPPQPVESIPLQNYTARKDELTGKLNEIRRGLAVIEKQSIHIEKVSKTISLLKQTIDAYDTTELKSQPNNIKILNQKFANIETRRAQESALLEKTRQDRLKAVAELLKTREDLTRFKAINITLEKQINLLKNKNDQITEQLNIKNKLVEKLQKDQNSYQEKISALKSISEEKEIRAKTLQEHLIKIQKEHKNRTEELEKIIRMQSDSYCHNLNNAAETKRKLEQKLMLIAEEKACLWEKYELLSAKSKEENIKSEKLFYEKNILLEDKKILESKIELLRSQKIQTEKKLSAITKENENLIYRKHSLDTTVEDLRKSAASNDILIRELQNKVSRFSEKNYRDLEQKLASKEEQIDKLEKYIREEKSKTACKTEKIVKDLELDFDLQKTRILGNMQKNTTKLQATIREKENSFRYQMQKIISLEAEIAKEKAFIKLERENAVKNRNIALLYKSLLETQNRKTNQLRSHFEENARNLEKSIHSVNETNLKLKNLIKKEQFGKAELRLKLNRYEKISASLTERIKWALTAKFPK